MNFKSSSKRNILNLFYMTLFCSCFLHKVQLNSSFKFIKKNWEIEKTDIE